MSTRGSPTVTIRLAPSTLEKLATCAEDLEATTSEVVRAAIEEYLSSMGYV